MQTPLTIQRDRYQPHQWWLLKGGEIVGIFAAPNAEAKARAALGSACEQRSRKTGWAA